MEKNTQKLYELIEKGIIGYQYRNVNEIEEYEKKIATLITTFLVYVEYDIRYKFLLVAGKEAYDRLSKLIKLQKEKEQKREEYLELEKQWNPMAKELLKRIIRTGNNRLELIMTGGSPMKLLRILYEKAGKETNVWIEIDADLKRRESLKQDLKTLEKAGLIERKFVGAKSRLKQVRLTEEAIKLFE